jgi:hypothetical protein
MNAPSPVRSVSAEGPKTDARWSLWLLGVALAGLSIAGYGLFNAYAGGDYRPAYSWLIGIAFWMSLLIGGLLLILITYVFDAGWSVIIRRQLEHWVGGFKWMALCFLPLLIGAWFAPHPGVLWKWLNPDHLLSSGHTVAHDPIYQWKAIWLNLPWMTFRTVLYFAVFVGVAALVRRCSFRMDETPSEQWVHRGRNTAAWGIFAVALSLTFAAFDWYMSLSYHWFSTMFGVWYFAASMRASVAFLVLLCWFLSTRGYLAGLYQRAHRYDLGTLLLAFTIFWAYISFSQMFLIYQGNIPEETFWYNLRLYAADGSRSGWWFVAMGLVLCHFFVPFLFLLFYSTKVSVGRLLFIAGWTLFFHLADLYFNLLPGEIMTAEGQFIPRPFSVHFYDLAAWIGMGALLLRSFLQSAKTTRPIPVHDPRILESLHHHE